MTHPADDRFAMPWAIEDEPPRQDEVIDLTDAVHEPGTDLHCPACLGRIIDVITTPDGRRYEHCLCCDRLWDVTDDHRLLVVAALPLRKK